LKKKIKVKFSTPNKLQGPAGRSESAGVYSNDQPLFGTGGVIYLAMINELSASHFISI
jgi:hypothetical protein